MYFCTLLTFRSSSFQDGQHSQMTLENPWISYNSVRFTDLVLNIGVIVAYSYADSYCIYCMCYSFYKRLTSNFSMNFWSQPCLIANYLMNHWTHFIETFRKQWWDVHLQLIQLLRWFSSIWPPHNKYYPTNKWL